MKLVFAGTSDFAVPSLDALLNMGCNVAAVVTQMDRGSGRGRRLVYSPIKEYALRRGVNLFQPEKISSPDSLDWLFSVGEIDFFVVVAYGQKIPASLLEWPKFGVVNVHGSLLPKYRGASPIHKAIVDGLDETGVTTMLMDEGWDTGDILLQKKVKIDPVDTYGTLSEKLANTGATLLQETLEGVRKDDIQPIKQDNSEASFAYSLKKNSGIVDWNKSAVDIANHVRGFTPKPGASTFYNGAALKIISAVSETEANLNHPVGSIISAENRGIRVACGSGSVLLLEVQPDSRKKMNALDWARGAKLDSKSRFDAF